ncbi:MAG: hypothetical protein KDG52_21780, partial [Rhodocyclaceae bacterium]|nr:hypothetical protein [Rhodocyclaceae bacterium]
MMRRLVVLVGLLAPFGSSHTAETSTVELGAREVAPRTPAEIAQQQRDLVEAQLWGLELAEIQRARQLMAGPRGAFSVANISPVEVLGIHARTPAERDRYAELFARMTYEDLQRVLAFQQAYDTALRRLNVDLRPVA